MNGASQRQPVRRRVANQGRLLELAVVYHNGSRRELAHALGRDASKLPAPNGNPKLDYLMSLAEILDWPVGDVIEAICAEPESTPIEAQSFDDLNTAAREAHRRGDFIEMRRAAHAMFGAARTADERATALLREAGAWDGLGRYARQLDAVRRALQEPVQAPDLRRLLEANLANANYTLWHLFEACGMAREIIESFADEPPVTRPARAAEAFAHYVLGHARRRLIGRRGTESSRHARLARASLQTAIERYEALIDAFDHDPWRGIVLTCRGGLLECDVELGDRTPRDAVDAVLATVGTPDDALVGDRLESRGWWCVCGCNIALRHLGGRDLQQVMSVLTDIGARIAQRLDNWAMRERLYTLEFVQRQRLHDLVGIPVDWTIDNNDLRVIIGTMGRFPTFRSTGWRILESATIVRSA